MMVKRGKTMGIEMTTTSDPPHSHELTTGRSVLLNISSGTERQSSVHTSRVGGESDHQHQHQSSSSSMSMAGGATDEADIIPSRNPTNNTAYANWRCDGDNVSSGIDNTSTSTVSRDKSNNNVVDDIAWRIIWVILQAWFIIWLLFAIIILFTEILSPQHSQKKKVQNTNTKAILSAEDEQLFLEISENIISSCSYSNLDSETGREECHALCHNHMCCFINDEDAAFQSHKYGCVDDPNKMCAAYAGCESLVLSEDDAIIYDADGVVVFGVGDNNQDDDATNNNNEQPTVEEIMSSIPEDESTITNNPSEELQLIQKVITSVCSNPNLHTKHGMLECASLCNPSMCCFDRSDIDFLNPKMDLVLKMEGITDDILDRTEMGDCLNEDDGTVHKHFCQVHQSCKNLLLLGAPAAITIKKREPPSGDPFIFTTNGVYDKSNQIIHGNSVTTEQERTLETVTVFFGMLIGLTVYLLVCKRASPSVVAIELALRSGVSRANNNSNEDVRAREAEMVDFVPP